MGSYQITDINPDFTLHPYSCSPALRNPKGQGGKGGAVVQGLGKKHQNRSSNPASARYNSHGTLPRSNRLFS